MKVNNNHHRETVKVVDKSKDHFRKLMREIKLGSAKDDIVYEDIIKRAITIGIFPEGHPDLNEWCEKLNNQVEGVTEHPYFYTKDEEPWTSDDKSRIKVLKL